MAEKAPAKSAAKPSGKPKGAGYKIYKHYTVKGGGFDRTNRFCPKCGPGIMMARHKDRQTCGNCHYTEMSKQ